MSTTDRSHALHAARLGELGSLLACVLAAAGCASSPGVMFDPADAVYQWPAAPDEPRMRYAGQLRGETGSTSSREGLEGLGDAIFGKEPSQGMVSPLAVCTDGAQRVFVADTGARAVHVLDLASKKYQRWPGKGHESSLVLPVALAFNAQTQELLVSDASAHAIIVFDAQGKVVRSMGEAWLSRPCGLVWDNARHRVIVVDSAAHQVVALDPQGEFLQRSGRRGGGPGEFNFPTYAAQDEQGRIYVSDSLNFRVQVLDAALSPISSFGKKGDMPGYFSQPKGVAIDREGHVYVADSNFEAIQVFDEAGTLLMTFGREGRRPGEFWLPGGMHADANGRLWVADSYNRRVQAFDAVHHDSARTGEKP